jgi:hypothetical protein
VRVFTDFFSAKVGERLVFVTLLPNLFLTGTIGILFLTGAPTHRPSWREVLTSVAQVGFLGWSLMAAAIVAFSLALHPLEYPLVQLVEGYWLGLPFGEVLSDGVAERRLPEWRALRELTDSGSTSQKRSAAAERLRWLPDAERKLRPTALGNVLYAGEVRAGERYGFRTLVAWRRLRPLLPERMRSQINEARIQLDASVRFCISSLIAAAASIPLLIQYDWWLAVSLAFYLFGWASYRAAIAAAKRFSHEIGVAFDLHHLELWDELRLDRPQTLGDERDRAAALCDFLEGDHELSPRQYAEFVYTPKSNREAETDSPP